MWIEKYLSSQYYLGPVIFNGLPAVFDYVVAFKDEAEISIFVLGCPLRQFGVYNDIFHI
jgi:hypothetical protein